MSFFHLGFLLLSNCCKPNSSTSLYELWSTFITSSIVSITLKTFILLVSFIYIYSPPLVAILTFWFQLLPQVWISFTIESINLKKYILLFFYLHIFSSSLQHFAFWYQLFPRVWITCAMPRVALINRCRSQGPGNNRKQRWCFIIVEAELDAPKNKYECRHFSQGHMNDQPPPQSKTFLEKLIILSYKYSKLL